jgi:hypothetical protein
MKALRWFTRFISFRKAYAGFIKKATLSIDTIAKISSEEFSMILKNQLKDALEMRVRLHENSNVF